MRNAHTGKFIGLSPRVRGNPAQPFVGKGHQGSIPACAGEPGPVSGTTSFWRVYPRVCGGTILRRMGLAGGHGLSPRVRGNLSRQDGALQNGGSIPACAGEPRTRRQPAWCQAVYPRVCGGTGQGQAKTGLRPGLSPRVRGNRRRHDYGGEMMRSIPACAGEPRRVKVRWNRSQVYPRVCGGTCPAEVAGASGGGLSPRVRGNPRCTGRASSSPGSIPACAGEPPHRQGARRVREVYPRVCGGTNHFFTSPGAPGGLSPRVRGNPGAWWCAGRSGRSIPACAGEPHRRRTGMVFQQVYPRVCGGTTPFRARPGPA